MTETEPLKIITEDGEVVEKKKVKNPPTPSFLDTFNLALNEEEYMANVNFRRKHPKLGGKIADLEQRVKKLELINETLIYLLKPTLKSQMKVNAIDYVDRTFDDFIERLGDVF